MIHNDENESFYKRGGGGYTFASSFTDTPIQLFLNLVTQKGKFHELLNSLQVVQPLKRVNDRPSSITCTKGLKFLDHTEQLQVP